MGFFSDLKDDLSQAVNEFKPDTTAAEPSAMPDAPSDINIDEFNLDDIESTLNSFDTKASQTESLSDDDFIMDDAELSDVPEKEEEVPAPTPEPKYEPAPEPQYTAPVPETHYFKPEPVQSVQAARTADNEVSVIMKSMIINGNMATEGSLEIQGAVVGNVEALGKLNITGSIQGNSSAAEIFAENAKITGEVKSMGAIKIGQSTVIIGNIFATSAVIAGAIKGDIDVKGPVILDASAIVMGNIKSKSVQINNGAVIEGMCSQCYAEVNPTSFFEELKKMK